MTDENKAKLKKELMRYGKEEIVDAILEQFGYEYLANGCLHTLRPKKTRALFDAEKKAIDRAKMAFDDYCAWMESMKKKYGSEDGKLYLSKFSDEDLKKTQQMCEKWEKALKSRDAAMKRFDRASRF